MRKRLCRFVHLYCKIIGAKTNLSVSVCRTLRVVWKYRKKRFWKHSKILIVVGQGAWEGPLVESTRRLDAVCRRKGINARFEYWGYDVDHDWPWWFKMVETYVPQLLG